jgi:hypothetical protein
MPEPILPKVPAVDLTTASIDLGYSSRLPSEDEATDLDPPLGLYEDEEEADSVIVPARHEQASNGERRIRAWRETSEQRHLARKAEEQVQARVRQERRGKLLIATGVTLALAAAVAAGVQVFDRVAEPAKAEAAPEPAPATSPVVEIADAATPADAPTPESSALISAETESPETGLSPAPEPPVEFDAQVIAGTLKIWTADATEWLQFDFRGAGPLEIQWLDAAGQQSLNSWSCDGYISRTTSRCYVGRTHRRIAVALRSGAAPGTWTLQACQPGTELCERIGKIQVPAEF